MVIVLCLQYLCSTCAVLEPWTRSISWMLASAGEMLYFGYQLMSAPFLSFGVMDKAGSVTRDFPIHTIKEPIMMHDFAVTHSHVIFFECPMIFDTMVRLLLRASMLWSCVCMEASVAAVNSFGSGC